MIRPVNSFALALTAVAIGSLALAPASARDRHARDRGAPERVKVGTLNCRIAPGVGLIIASQKRVDCSFIPSNRGPRERYSGSITKVGVDLGFTTGGALAWGVYAPTTRATGALAGNYGGVSAEATVGVGAGANVLVGGSNRTITLQPISVQGQTGLSLAAGVSGLELRSGRDARPMRHRAR